jgi:hypothetical protein
VKKTAILIFCLVVQVLEAQENQTKIIREAGLQFSSLPAAKFFYTQHFIFPFLRGSSFLTENNNIDFGLTAEISPVSINGLAEVVWTPVAFFQTAAGGRVGSGWNIKLFGGDVYGIGFNREGANNRAEHSGFAFDGFLWKAQVGAALQVDMAAFFPGDWTRIVIRTYHEINYKSYSAAEPGESWYYEDDEGENCNGYNYYCNVFIGYQMPIKLDTLGFLAEADLFLYDTPDREIWGDDRIRWTISGLGRVAITKKFNATLLVQFRLVRNYIDPNWEDLYYRKRHINNSDPFRLAFYQAVLSLAYQF